MRIGSPVSAAREMNCPYVPQGAELIRLAGSGLGLSFRQTLSVGTAFTTGAGTWMSTRMVRIPAIFTQGRSKTPLTTGLPLRGARWIRDEKAVSPPPIHHEGKFFR